VSVVTPDKRPGWEGTDSLIHEGDVLHVDYGLSSTGLHTDTQHLAYVLRASAGERTPPPPLAAGLRKSNRMMDIQLEEMRPGRSGNDVLKSINARMAAEGIDGQVFSHSLGDWGHGPGAVTGAPLSFRTTLWKFDSVHIGFNNLPTFVPVLGELEIVPDTFYSIELFASHTLLGTNKTLRFMQEEDVYWVPKRKRWEWVYGRQERLHLIDAAPEEGLVGEHTLRVQL
jgi:methionine aminopeptidase